MFKEIVDDRRRTTDIGQSQKLTMSTLCSGELKKKNFWLEICSKPGPHNLFPYNLLSVVFMQIGEFWLAENFFS